MAVEFTRGDILDTDADYVVVPVNCVGKISASNKLAVQWSEGADDSYLKYYTSICRDGNLLPGQIVLWEGSSYILAATHDRRFQRSQYTWISNILLSLQSTAIDRQWWTRNTETRVVTPKTVAMPRLGRMWDGLDWYIMRQMIIEYLDQVPTLFLVYE
jgi:hypothetical protein